MPVEDIPKSVLDRTLTKLKNREEYCLSIIYNSLENTYDVVGNACYAFFSGLDGEEKERMWVGQASMPSLGRLLGFSKILTGKDIKEGHLRWMDWLYNRSPHSHVYLDKPTTPIAVVELNTECDTWEFHQAAAMVRMNLEHPEVEARWILFTKYGINEELAYLWSCLKHNIEAAQMYITEDLTSHAAVSYLDQNSVKTYCVDKKPRKKRRKWKNYSNFRGHGSMWSQEGDYSMYGASDFFSSICKAFSFEESVSTDHWGDERTELFLSLTEEKLSEFASSLNKHFKLEGVEYEGNN